MTLCDVGCCFGDVRCVTVSSSTVVVEYSTVMFCSVAVLLSSVLLSIVLILSFYIKY